METFDVAVVGLGALGSAAAYHLSRKNARVVAFEQFELGHVRGASHDTSRIIRTSYGSEPYVRLAQSAYRDWADFEQASGERLVTVTGGVVFIPKAGPYSAADFATSLTAAQVPYELLTPEQVARRWPQFRLTDDVETVYTADTGIVHASRSVAAFQMQARMHGAQLRDRTPVLRLTPTEGGVIVHTQGGDVLAGKVVLAADAWTNTLLEPLGAQIPLITMQEQVTYFRPGDPEQFDRERFPVWIWEDDECFYGFPTYGEPTVKAARDLSNNLMSPAERTFAPSPALLEELGGFMGRTIPGSGEVLRTVTCQYAITPDRNFVISPLERHPDVLVALGAGHAFKFAPAIGRVLAELALEGSTSDDISAFEAPTTVGAA
ncbi:N-methyl-L-tryptophan oxidase [Kineosporia rhizophila]|uniref:N-methyl-L-tryptophan oxidase n=1 Tax=Kineosporia TaxID=49184 RepID=UPI001E5C4477|nr:MULTISPECIES: N-methyl-L-tryptophan oxidase [Kineosporia]MCE0535295.1 N-methyl-L-tryptophan oxidase [Kineosporia rhizophila]GLY16925.1 N-methyltryptophan oxidase [Kineosporia sp. NBRC 101677]